MWDQKSPKLKFQAEKARGCELAQKISRFASEQVEYHQKALKIAENLNNKLKVHQANVSRHLMETVSKLC